MKNYTEEDYAYILDLKEDWDDDGALAYNPKIYRRAIDFINSCGDIKRPRMSLCRDASIDLDWWKDYRKLLLNILNKNKPEYHYYGHVWNGGALEIKEAIEGIVESNIPNENLIEYIKKFK